METGLWVLDAGYWILKLYKIKFVVSGVEPRYKLNSSLDFARDEIDQELARDEIDRELARDELNSELT